MLVEKTNDGITVSGSMAGAPQTIFKTKEALTGLRICQLTK